MIDPVEFFDLISDKTNRDSKVRGNFLAYIDESYDPTKYPQVLPRVMSPGQPLSHKGYMCLDSYRPMPGDRVLLVPAGVSDYVIVGATEPSYEDQEDGEAEFATSTIYPGDLILSISNHNVNQTIPGTGGHLLEWGATSIYDPYGCWTSGSNVTLPFPPECMFSVSGRVQMPPTTNSKRVELTLYENGGPTRGGYNRTNFSGTIEMFLDVAGWRIVGGGTLVQFFVANSTNPGNSTTYVGGSKASVMEIFYAGPGPFRFDRDSFLPA